VSPPHAVAPGLVELTCHPDTPTAAVRHLTASVARHATGPLVLAYSLVGDVGRLSLPASGTPRMGRDLWRRTCFEAFVGTGDAPSYHELNFSPSGEWAVFAFRRYRDGGPLADATLAPHLAVRRLADGVALDAEVDLARLAPEYGRGAVRLALTAVVQEASGALSYWSIRHPPGRPDFHHADAFALQV
jgi:hypothetical protein